MLKLLHHTFVFRRRVKVLAAELALLIEPHIKTILDVGSGDGTVSKLMQDKIHHVELLGIDTMARPSSAIPFSLYDGRHIPYADNSFDLCMFIDVLHHLTHIREILAEAKRVSARYILIKDHLYANRLDFKILKLMDELGNRPHGVATVYNYLTENEWAVIFRELGLEVVKMKTSIPLYPFPFSLIFGRRLHFITVLKILS